MPPDNENAPGFAPDEPTDGREPGDWETRYPEVAKQRYVFEAGYLGIHLLLVPVLIIALAIMSSKYDREKLSDPAVVTKDSLSEIGHLPLGWLQLSYAWLGGVLGGTLFSIKWLYHSVAKYIWNFDRRLWRLFTPHISGALAFIFVVLAASRVILIFDGKVFQSQWVCLGMGFLIGYFSDSAMAKLSEVAQTMFGATETNKR